MLNIFITFTKPFFKKLEYCFLVERTKIEKASLPYKTAILEANVKTNRMVTTKWAYQRERSFTSNYSPSIETHLAVVRGLPTKKFQTECINEKSSTERRS